MSWTAHSTHGPDKSDQTDQGGCADKRDIAAELTNQFPSFFFSSRPNRKAPYISMGTAMLRAWNVSTESRFQAISYLKSGRDRKLKRRNAITGKLAKTKNYSSFMNSRRVRVSSSHMERISTTRLSISSNPSIASAASKKSSHRISLMPHCGRHPVIGSISARTCSHLKRKKAPTL